MLNILFPEKYICLFCREERIFNEKYICTNCKELVEYTNKEIRLNLPSIEKVYYSIFYNRFIREKLHEYKFGGKIIYINPLERFL